VGIVPKVFVNLSCGLIHLERAPIPIPWNTLPHALWSAILSYTEDTAHGSLCLAPTIDDRCCRCLRLLFFGALAVCPAQPGYLPALIFRETVFAGAAGCSKGVVVGILVKSDGVGRVGIAENVTATAAVMSTIEVIESFGTSRLIANRSFSIRLQNFVRSHLLNCKMVRCNNVRKCRDAYARCSLDDRGLSRECLPEIRQHAIPIKVFATLEKTNNRKTKAHVP
jgi:hypothetical protein